MEPQGMSDLEEIFWHYSPGALRAYFWLLFTFGLGVCVWAFGKTKKKGYLLIALYFASPFIGAATKEIGYQIHKEEYRRIEEEKNREIEAMRERGEPILIEEDLTFPFFESCLALGIFLLARVQIQGANQPPKPTRTPDPRG